MHQNSFPRYKTEQQELWASKEKAAREKFQQATNYLLTFIRGFLSSLKQGSDCTGVFKLCTK